jgi:hypothetical protein
VGGEVFDLIPKADCFDRSAISSGTEHAAEVLHAQGHSLGAPGRVEFEDRTQRRFGPSEIAAQDTRGAKVDPCSGFTGGPPVDFRQLAEQVKCAQRFHLGLVAIA